MFQVLISPGRVGSNDFVLQLMTGDAALLPAKEATLAVSLPERGIEPVGASRHAWCGWPLACARRPAALVRPLAHPDRGAGLRFERVTLEDQFEVK